MGAFLDVSPEIRKEADLVVECIRLEQATTMMIATFRHVRTERPRTSGRFRHEEQRIENRRQVLLLKDPQLGRWLEGPGGSIVQRTGRLKLSCKYPPHLLLLRSSCFSSCSRRSPTPAIRPSIGCARCRLRSLTVRPTRCTCPTSTAPCPIAFPPAIRAIA